MPSLDVRTVIDKLNEQGWEVERTGGGHWKAVPPDKSKPLVHFSSCREPHALRNTLSDLRKSGFVWEDPPRPKRAANEGQEDPVSEVITRPHLQLVPEPPPTPPSPVGPPSAPETFGQALRRLRLDAGGTHESVGDLLGVTGGAVGHWEADVNAPILDHYRQLVELFPELANAPLPDVRDIAKPIGPLGHRRSSLPPIPEELENTISESTPELPVMPDNTHPTSPSIIKKLVIRFLQLTQRVKQDPDVIPLLQEARDAGMTLDDILEILQ